ncbi:sporulation integral membrane protein YlbJ [Bacillus sp. 31A1R]|uniref:Sporulation integral membrane protein YlbJ n=1 Tax=Robertmurraya mangrovi TaxID=3098077 RepID=A0ABU5IU51_9BACI|nr:sporulation integral membrane protein YlbJ [Bacillus sp. 31A1R]MDZ5470677.1 sporulation integral membrane protein YlbJ [Bacillus sp. 31A1R]
MFQSKLKTIILASSITIMAISLISFPQESVDASIRGLDMWWEIVFPSLLPFFIVSELLIGFGVVKFIGVLLEPLMRPLFKVPGVGGFVWAMGMASGFPAGAKLTARMRQEEQLTRIEAERLVSFTNCSNPLFIFGAVSVGFFYNAKLGILLALAHYLGNFTVGLIMRFYGKDEDNNSTQNSKFSVRAAFSALHRTRIKEERPIGKLLGDAVMSSIQTLLMIGGFIILFSVINKLLYHLNIISFLGNGVEFILQSLHLPVVLSIPFISGLFEITLGSQLTSQVQESTLMQQAIITSFILAFSGFSVQAQVASILAQTDIRFKPFFVARIMHGIFASIFAFLLWEPVYERFSNTEPSNAIPVALLGDGSWFSKNLSLLSDLGPIITICALSAYILIYSNRTFIKKDIQ